MTSKSIPFIRADRIHASPMNERGDSAIVAIVDDGLDVLHSAFQDQAGRTRIIAFWDQTDDTEQSDGVTFGRVYSQQEINAFIDTQDPPRALAAAHGTFVTSIAAGRKSVGATDGSPVFAGGVAPAAKILFVKPRKKPLPGQFFSIGASISHVAALEFIDRVATERKLPVVVNLSIGMNGGAHDGTTLFESAIEDFTRHGRAKDRVVVKAAGNEKGFHSHAVLELRASERDHFVWNSRSVAREEDIIELWFNAADRFRFRLHQPTDLGPGVSRELSVASPAIDEVLPNRNRCRLTYVDFSNSNGASQVLVTISPGDAPKIAGGDWKLEVNSDQRVPAGGRIEAWLERSKTRPIKFKDDRVEESTITIPGTSQSIITVGAATGSDPIEIYDRSSEGPTRDGRHKPELIAPGVKLFGARARKQHEAIEDSGTSFAAPHVTGAVALLLSLLRKQPSPRQLNAAQVRSGLILSARNFDGTWQPDSGYGMLDAEALVKAFLR